MVELFDPQHQTSSSVYDRKKQNRLGLLQCRFCRCNRPEYTPGRIIPEVKAT